MTSACSWSAADLPAKDLAQACTQEASILEDWFGKPLSIASYHRPDVRVLTGDPVLLYVNRSRAMSPNPPAVNHTPVRAAAFAIASFRRLPTMRAFCPEGVVDSSHGYRYRP
jgi:hypothetical protein